MARIDRCRFRLWAPAFLGALSFYCILGLGSTLQATPTYAARLPPLVAPFRFVLYGDTREGMEPWRTFDDENRRRIVARIVERSPKFVVNSGDLVGSGGERRSWARFDGLNREIREKGIAYFPALGNHEYHDFGGSGLAHYFAHFPDLENKKWYSFAAGPIRFVVLDSNRTRLTPDELSSQADFLAVALAAADGDPTVKLVVFVYHDPAFTNSTLHGPSEWTRKNFVLVAAPFRKRRMHVAGHVHSYERFEIEGGVAYVVSGGGGAPLHTVETDPAKISSPPAFSGPARRWHHFIEADVDESGVKFQVHALSGTEWVIADRFEIKF